MNNSEKSEKCNAAINVEAVGLNAGALENSEAGVESKIDAGIKIGAGSESYTGSKFGVVSKIDAGSMNGGSEIEAGIISGVESEIDAGIDTNISAGIIGAMSEVVTGWDAGEQKSAADDLSDEPRVRTWVKNSRAIDNQGDIGVEPVIEVKAKKKAFSKKVKILTAAVVLCASLAFPAFTWAQKDVTLVVDGKKIVTKTFASNVQSLINQQKIKLNEKDRVIPQPDTGLKDGLQVTITRALPVSIDVDAQRLEINSSAENVKQLIAEQKIVLNEMDKVMPGLEEKLSPGMEIKVARVEQKIVEKEVMVAYRTESRETPLLTRGVSRVSRPGKTGTERQVWQVTYRDGKEVESQMVRRQIVSSPVAEIVDHGTKQRTIDRGGEIYRYSREMYMTATAYSYTGRNTASGVPPYVGSVAVDPRVIPIGTRMYIDGYGYAKASDTGGDIKGNRIDVFLETEHQCRKWGVRKVKIYILE